MIAEMLGRGVNNAVTGRELAYLLNTNIRTVTAQIERERRKGAPICASMDSDTAPGYYLPEDDKELETYCAQLKQRALALLITRSAILKAQK